MKVKVVLFSGLVFASSLSLASSYCDKLNGHEIFPESVVMGWNKNDDVQVGSIIFPDYKRKEGGYEARTVIEGDKVAAVFDIQESLQFFTLKLIIAEKNATYSCEKF